jgi:hypothetical protein
LIQRSNAINPYLRLACGDVAGQPQAQGTPQQQAHAPAHPHDPR